MIDLEFLESLIRAVDESSIDSVEIERGGTRIRVSKTPPAAPRGAEPANGAGVHVQGAASPALQPGAGGAGRSAAEGVAEGASAAEAGGPGGGEEEVADGRVEVPAPMVGTFYRAPAPDAPPYVEVGDRVQVGDTLCIIEAMKLMNELECEVAGTISEICVENADPVEYGQVLFRIEPA
ncbi:MAG: acetyl-CoA carboxylase biotin carboxyl carrier protein [Longimicrobiales bacterium]|nr:acetyl-CoA carboxylase biotin carboxyl carrier protein [Longimicrobiales bacterium]